MDQVESVTKFKPDSTPNPIPRWKRRFNEGKRALSSRSKPFLRKRDFINRRKK